VKLLSKSSSEAPKPVPSCREFPVKGIAAIPYILRLRVNANWDWTFVKAEVKRHAGNGTNDSVDDDCLSFLRGWMRTGSRKRKCLPASFPPDHARLTLTERMEHGRTFEVAVEG
jgi:hypothetical protein